jgi:serine/threonine protein kinase
MTRLLQFNPTKRPTAEQCLQHPYLAQFHNAAEEPSCEKKIIVEIDDNVKFVVVDFFIVEINDNVKYVIIDFLLWRFDDNVKFVVVVAVGSGILICY